MEYICYRFSLVDKQPQRFKYNANAFFWPQCMYVFELEPKKFENIFIIRPAIINEVDSTKSLTTASWFKVQRLSRFTSRKHYSATTSYTTVTVVRLPPPYDTNCRNYALDDYSGKEGCEQKCLQHYLVRELKKVPFSGVITEPVLFRHVAWIDMNKAASALILYNIEDKCHLACYRPACFESYTVTKLNVITRDAAEEFVVKIPQEPSCEITHTPAVKLVEFVVFILSSLGCWFGISMLGLNPFQNRKGKFDILGNTLTRNEISYRVGRNTRRIVTENAPNLTF